MAWHCTRCQKRAVWCTWCKVRHCACNPHKRTRPQHGYGAVVIRRADGVHRFMSSRRYAHLKGAQKGGRATAVSPKAYRLDSETARKAARARWDRHTPVNKPTGLRLGLPRKKSRPEVSRRHLRYLYAKVPRLGIGYDLGSGFWTVVSPGQDPVRISERTALRRLGHLPYARKNWVPSEDEPAVVTGILPAGRKPERGKR